MVQFKKSICIMISYFLMASYGYALDLKKSPQPLIIDILDINWAFLGKRNEHFQSQGTQRLEVPPLFGLRIKIKMDFLGGEK